MVSRILSQPGGQVRGVLRSRYLDSLWAVATALACGAVLLVITGHDPVVAYREWVERAILRPSGMQETVVRAIPLLLAGSAVLLALRAGVWNIGIDGQVLAGALTTAVVASELSELNRILMAVIAAGAGFLAGAVWALIPALLRGQWGINEIVTTIMFNYIAISTTAWLVKGPLGDPDVVAPQTPLIPRELRLETIGDTRIHVGIFIAFGMVIVLGFFFSRTVAGYELSVTGANSRAARHGQIRVAAYITAGLVVSGAIAALAGANDVLATKGTFQGEWNPAYGFVAFALVFLGQRSILGLIPAALVFGQLSYAADVMPRAANVAPAFFTFIEGALLVTLAVMVWKRSAHSRLPRFTVRDTQ
jgi:simple sugar transport system permease protein